MSTMEISRQHGIHQESAWFFKRKLQQAMTVSDRIKLEKVVEVDEAIIGGYEPGATGRTHGKKKAILLAVELGKEVKIKLRHQMLRAKAVVIDNYSSEELSKGIESIVRRNSLVVTDKWKGYPKAIGERFHLSLPSLKGENMPEIHRLIFNLKNWLRGIHHNVSAAHIQSYLNEFFFRFNYRNTINSLPKLIIKEMIKHDWLPYKIAIAS